MADSAIHIFCAQQREWLAAELASEKAEVPAITSGKPGTAEEESGRSNVLVGLEVEEISVGLYGRTVVTLARSHQNKSTGDKCDAKGSPILLPAHRFTTGDEVEIRRTKGDSSKKGQHHSGVVSQVTDASIAVALFSKQQYKKSNDANNDEDESVDILDSGVPLSLVPSASIEVHKKYIQALNNLEKYGTSHSIAGKVVEALFDPSPENRNRKGNDHSPSTKLEFVPFNKNLEESQVQAIEFALLEGRAISCIHGPPGTGKTTTLVELIKQAVHNQNLKVLVCAPSNVAVDNLLARLVADDPGQSQARSKNKSKKLRVVRIGHPARLQPAILPYSMEALVQSSDGTEIVRDVRKELQSFLNVLSDPKSRGNDKRVAYREMKTLRQEVRQREEKVVSELLVSAQVVCCTCVGAANNLLNKASDNPFDLCVIDEAAQALESACWIPALRAKRLILAGDHKQLPPTIQSNQSVVAQGLGRTMFERVMQLYGDDDPNKVDGQVSRMLRVQYRMNKKISDWASKASYGELLRTHETVANRTLAELTADSSSDSDDHGAEDFGPLLLIDTAGCAMFESTNAAGSRYNEIEADLLAQHVRRLVAVGVQAQEIAVITPYNGQVEVLRSLLLPAFPRLEIRSVDGFQGGEREAVVLSMVRSSDRGGQDGIGFLRDDRRLNVAVTRAKRHCCVVADSETVSKSSFIKGLIAWMEENGETRSAIEFRPNNLDDDQIQSDILAAEQEMNRFQISKDFQTRKLKTSEKKEVAKEKELQLIRQIDKFSKSAVPGAEMAFHSELNANQRRIIHETAEKLGMEHKSEGLEGVDRRITVKMPGLVKAVDIQDEEHQDQSSRSSEVNQSSTAINRSGLDDSRRDNAVVGQPFSALSIDSDHESSGSSIDGARAEAKHSIAQSNNELLAVLARKRENRGKQRQSNLQAKDAQPPQPKKKTKKRGQKLGGKAKPVSREDTTAGGDELDDMAFLDAQIEKNQNSHGRTIEGKGQSYRTVMNGILISKPKPQEKQRNAKASAALQSKLKQKQDGRKVKKKKKL